ncbi:MAG TPA: hypothetical protein DEG69_22210 [Flavobacteriaceae bacterium]|jgi:antitoxin component YwqK of YwqJK toxin-antitoxin module|nr:hypothetical protein [Flavobacteriaceae bacterium]|tara:strand:- start:212814 stop:213512 length:699 start_codon:yes stop_codon:yes gene_type:complete
MKNLFSLFLGIVFSSQLLLAQEKVNQFDADGKRDGVWEKYYPGTKQLRYKGQFDHGKETGVFKFYCETCKDQPMAIKEFSSNGNNASVQYFTIKGKLVSEGEMEGKNRVGEWVYYHEKSDKVMTREFYKNGELDGVKTTYYPDGTKTEETHYQDGLKQGENNYYSPEGILLKKLQYVNDKLSGEAVYYDANGTVTIKGYYKEGKKNGLWRYYKNGKIEMEETYPKPKNPGKQ